MRNAKPGNHLKRWCHSCSLFNRFPLHPFWLLFYKMNVIICVHDCSSCWVSLSKCILWLMWYLWHLRGDLWRKCVIYSTGTPSSTERRMHMACVSRCFPKISSRGGSRGRVQGLCTPPEMTCAFPIQLVFCKKKKKTELCGLLVLK